MIYHLLPDEKFIDNFISKVIEASDNPRENQFLIRKRAPWNMIKVNAGNVVEAPLASADLDKIIQKITEKDLLLVHYLKKDVSEWLLKQPKHFPVGIVFWGAEFFNRSGINFQVFLPKTKAIFRPNLLNKPWLYRIPGYRHLELFYESRIKGRRLKKIKSKAFKRLSHIYHHNRLDVQLVVKSFGLDVKHEYFIYPRIYDFAGFDKELPPPIEIDQSEINILVGNSASYSNNHLDLFDMLPQFGDMKIYCPLSYGDFFYRKMVKEAAEELFGSQFVPILSYLSPEEYYGILKCMDAGVFGNLRPMGMGNITVLLALGKPVFLHRENNSYRDLREKGFIVYPMEELYRLKDLKSEPIYSNIEKAKLYFEGGAILDLYRRLF